MIKLNNENRLCFFALDIPKIRPVSQNNKDCLTFEQLCCGRAHFTILSIASFSLFFKKNNPKNSCNQIYFVDIFSQHQLICCSVTSIIAK